MAVEAVDARHEAMLCLERAITAVESGELDDAEMHAIAAANWLRYDVGQEPEVTRVKA